MELSEETFDGLGLTAPSTFLRAIFHRIPVTSPFLAPLEGELAPLTDLGLKAVLGFSLHGLTAVPGT